MSRAPRIPIPVGATSNPEIGARYQPELTSAIGDFYTGATRLGGVDAVITEMVRLRCARTHDCRLCKAVRLRTARDAGVDDDMTSQIDRYEQSSLDERIKVALRYTDAFNTRPGEVSQELARQLARHFSPEEIVTMSLDIMKYSTQKMHVTLGLDVRSGIDVDSGAVTWFEFDDAGRATSFVSDAEESRAVSAP